MVQVVRCLCQTLPQQIPQPIAFLLLSIRRKQDVYVLNTTPKHSLANFFRNAGVCFQCCGRPVGISSQVVVTYKEGKRNREELEQLMYR